MTFASAPNWQSPSPDTMRARAADWRCGCVVYQIIVDRFAPSRRLESKRDLYAAPRSLRPWDEVPGRGRFLDEHKNSSAELEFWGGDLDSLRGRLDHVAGLGANLLYLNPIFDAFTNHKYDANDYLRVDAQYGTNAELKALADDLHGRGMRLMLDGVFNHVGRRSPRFQHAQANPDSPEAAWFHLGEHHPHGYRSWRNGRNLPELNVENPEVRAHLWEARDSVVRTWLRDYGVDGWRLDVAPDLGFDYLAALTAAAHEEKADCAVIGECWNYPETWLRVVDGILNMHLRLLILNLMDGKMRPAAFARRLDRLIEDCGIEGLLRCHLVLDNHDTPRMTTLVPQAARQRLAWLLAMTLPGAPTIYYGSELGMQGGNDPLCRAPMRWDLDVPGNPTAQWVRTLLALRKDNPALVVGDCRVLDGDNILAFLRFTDKARETLIVVMNPTDHEAHDIVSVRHSPLMDAAPMECLLTGERLTLACGTLEITMPPNSARVFRTVDRAGGAAGGYSMFKRVP